MKIEVQRGREDGADAPGRAKFQKIEEDSNVQMP